MVYDNVLRFNKEKEQLYRNFFLTQDIIACRAISFLVILVMIFLVILDYFRVAGIGWVLASRLIVCVTFGLLILLTYSFKFSPLQLQLTLLTINLIFISSVFFMDKMTDMPRFFLTNSTAAYLFISVTISGLWFRFGAVMNILLVAVFLLYFPYSRNGTFQRSQIANILICLVISLLIGFLWERNKRVLFLQHMQMNSLLRIFSHDLISPFNSLLGLLNLKEKKEISADQFDQHIELIRKGTSSNLLLLQNLVKWSKSQMEGFKPEFSRVNLHASILEAVEVLRNVAVEKNVKLNYKEGDFFCNADEEMIKLIIRNTLSNAIKFSRDNGKVEISTSGSDGFVLIEVKDEGVGMSQDEINSLFHTGVMPKPGTSNERGSGIGLFITRQFVLLNNGEISISSAKGAGTNVKIRIPAAR